MNDVIAGRQHDVRGRAALLADQLERAGIVGLVGEHPPYQPAIDDRQILAVARRQRQHRLARDRGARRRHHRRDRGERRLHDGGLVQRPGKCRDRPRPGRWRQIQCRSARSIRNRGRRHRWGAVLEHLGRGRGRQEPNQRHCKRQRRKRPAGPPVFPETVAPCSHDHAFHRKRGKFKPRMASSGWGNYGTDRNTQY